jgi:hypothetical protein
MTLDDAIAALYAREINRGVETFWDGGISVWIGDRINGHKVETAFSRHRMGEAAKWLLDEATRLLSRGVSVGSGLLERIARRLRPARRREDVQALLDCLCDPAFASRMGGARRRLFEVAKALDVPPSFFFKGPRRRALYTRENIELVRAYFAIHNPTVRESIAETIRAISAAPLSYRRGS